MTNIKAGHHKLIFRLFLGLTVLFGVLAIWAYFPGEEIYQETFSDNALSNEQPEQHHGEFTLDKRQVVQMNITSPNLDNSWLWLKLAILDSEDRVVADKSFDLEYYSGYQTGEHWSEGDKDTYAVFTLPAGTYKILAYAKDAQQRKSYTRPMRERIKISVDKGIVLSRYFIFGSILFALLSFVTAKVAGWATSRRVRKHLQELDPSDTVVWEGKEYDVDGKIEYYEQSWYWVDYALLGDTEVLWLSIDGSTEEVSIWREVRDMNIRQVPPPEFLEYDGINYSQVEAGRADTERLGNTGERKQGREMQYFDYDGPGDKMLSVEKWHDEIEVSIGREISPYDLTIHNSSSQADA